MKLENKLALVTGATSGIGLAVARSLAAEGARLVLTARGEEKLRAVASEIPGATPLVLDARDAAATGAALEPFCFDVVVPNAGLGRGTEPLHEGVPAEWDEMIDTNIKGVLYTLRATLPKMLERKSGDVVLIGSVAGRQVYPGGNVYCATKHAVRGIYEALRVDCFGSGVRFTTVDPGMVKTGFSLGRFRGDAERAEKVYEGMTPMSGEDVAEAVLFAVTRPPHVNIGEIVMWSSAQASTWMVARDAQ
ncbi:MAG: SDR family NAD(P)-dependent oxidoreductase [Planctomycetota bacterium]|nr:SDR family NAD(P)-dependent oxidoreductase [Planctomycetota bacterium]